MARPSTLASWGARARTTSSLKIACSTSVAPRPPYSCGQEMPAQPASLSARCQSRRKAKAASSPSGSLPGWFLFSHPRSSSRKASSSGDRVKSTAADPSTLGPMRIGIFLAYWPWFSLDEQVELAGLADELGLDSVWISEAWGQDAVSVLGLLAGSTERIALGSGLMQIPARQPAATAMAAATLDVASGGRFRLGLGVSGPQASEGWAGRPLPRPP